ncbi:acetylxylan esterase [Novisyntrophococcus fermenticellae]|uniref:acetylxylan esterase n=1 Tax=Novisyntrophococcus fermenticellae TaxID=2068655 RepID=UPI0038CD8B43
MKTDYCYRNKKVDKLIFKGLDNTAIYGWHIYSTAPGNKHCIVTTHGYRSSKKQPFLYLHWLDIGYDVLVFDLRLQGKDNDKWRLMAPDKRMLKELIETWQLGMQKSKGWDTLFWCNHEPFFSNKP